MIHLLIDKSTLQSLSQDEVNIMATHYWVVYAPTLFVEILGDLKKISGDVEASKKEIRKTAPKISGFQSTFSANFRFLLYANLLGNTVESDYRPIMLGGETVVAKDGSKGIFFDEQPEYKALRRWTEGIFTEAEELLSDSWRKSTKAIDLELWRKHHKSFSPIRSLSELPAIVESIISNQHYQLENLRWLLSEVSFEENKKTEIFNYWLQHGMPPIKVLAPYAYYCLKVFTSFYLAAANGLIGTRPTNRVDLEYILYFPFCKVFASTDKFLKTFAPLFLGENQEFIWGETLKEDLKKINEYWNYLSDEEKKSYRQKYGDYPPEIANSITSALWEKMCYHREEAVGNPEITPEREKEIMDRMRPMLEAIDKIRQ